MLKAQTTQIASRRTAVPAQRAGTPVLSRVSTRVRAAEDNSAGAPPALDLSPNTQAATGYVEFDTAGQPNMYPVVTKAYEAGSDQDTANTGAANTVVGIGAAVIAVGVLAVGLGALSQQGAAPAETAEQFKSLSEYAAAFAAEL